MYLRSVHAELDIPSLQKFIRENPLGVLITSLTSPNFSTLQCSHIPWIIDASSDESKPGILRGHMARANPHAKAIVEAVKEHHPSNGPLEQEVLILFNGPAHAYVTPKFYTETKPDTGKVVPTWNYSAVQVYGKAKIYYDTKDEGGAETSGFLQKQINDLTDHSEADILSSMGGNTDVKWEVDDAPAPYVDILKKAILGLEIEITRLEGKYKMSQEMSEGDREGVAKGFESLGTENGLRISKTVEERGALKAAAKKAAS